MSKVRKRFQVRVMKDREVTETRYARNPEKTETGIPFLVTHEKVVYPVSYMVFFPSGHSVWFASKEAMEHAGLVETANFEIDMETGEPVEPVKQYDLEKVVEAKTRRSSTRSMEA